MNLPTSQLDEADRNGGTDVVPAGSRPAVIKFTYPSGSRPLDGYTIKRGVGRGGFGEVYFATSDAGKEVALKLIRRNLDVEIRGVTQCLNLKHPNLIGLFDIRADEMDDQWVIMEYVSGESLEDAIDRHPNGMPIDEMLFWMHGMCAGVAYLHDHGIVHRDLKPGNIFLDESTVKIGDYGLAKFISCSRRSGQTESVGTVHYMAPEISNGRYGREIDTYALGIILHEMLTGKVPFEGESVGEVLMKHLTAEPDLTRLDEPYREIVRRSLAKDPDQRVKSVGEMLAMLPAGGNAGPASAGVNGPAANAAPTMPPAMAAASASPAPPSPASNAAADGRVEEPIWRAVRESFADLRRGKEMKEWPLLPKALVVFAIVFGCIFAAEFVLPLAIPALMCYGVYYLIWASCIRPGVRRRASEAGEAVAGTNNLTAEYVAGEPRPKAAEAPARSAAMRYADRVRRRRQRPNWRDRVNQELAAKPWRERLSELTGAMLMATVLAALGALVAPIILADGVSSQGLATYVWLTLVAALGSWAVLIPAKISEGRVEDHVPLRLITMGLGALVGIAAWGLAEMLLMRIPHANEPLGMDAGFFSHQLLGWSRTTGGANPTLVAYVTYFAFLFLLLRWWRQAEFTRSVRLSLWSVAVCVGWAWLLQIFWSFPQPTGMLVAGVTAFAIQMSSPWLPPSRRRMLSEELNPTT